MSRTFHDGSRRLRVRGIRRTQPDLPKLARALIDLAQAQAEIEARTEYEGRVSQSTAGRTRPRRRQR